MRYTLLLLLVALPVAAQDIQHQPPEPTHGEPIAFATPLLGNLTWHFGDGRQAHGRMASHAFPHPGIFLVELRRDGVTIATLELPVRIPDDLYVTIANTTPTPTESPEPPRMPPPRSRSTLDRLTDNPLLLFAVLGGLVAGAIAGTHQLRKRRSAPQEQAREEPPEPLPEPPVTEEELIPGAEDPPEEHSDDELPIMDAPLELDDEADPADFLRETEARPAGPPKPLDLEDIERQITE